MSEPGSSDRRSFLNWFLGGSVATLFGSIFYPVFRFLSPPRIPEAATHRVEAAKTNDPELIDRGFKIVRFGSEPVLLIRLAGDGFRAYAATCTHLDCVVEYQQDQQRIWCNCHNGEYDLNGINVAGPPPRPLERYNVHVIAGSSGQPGTVVVERA